MRPKITITPKQITTITYVIVVLGIISSIMPTFISNNTYIANFCASHPIIFHIIIDCISSFSFSFSFYPPLLLGLVSLPFLNLIFYIILLFGVILYSKSIGKETRLIRCIIAIILVSNIFYFTYWFIQPFIYAKGYRFDYVNWILLIIKTALLSFLSYFILINLHETKILDVPYRKSFTKPILNTKKEASIWERLVNFLIDNLICTLVFSDFIVSFTRNSENYSLRTGILFVMLSIVYFTFFEILLGSTPAKLLTETRVLDDTGGKLTFGTALGRSLARYIPLEPLSFFGESGWHDSFSKTTVVKEVQTGIKGQRYLLIIPFFIILVFSVHYGKIMYKNYQSKQYKARAYDHKISQIKKKLQNLTTSDVVELESATQEYLDEALFLKIEKIEGDNIKVALITTKNEEIRNMKMLEEVYNNGEVVEKIDALKTEKVDDTEDIYMLAQFPLYSIKRADLNNAYTEDFDDYCNLKRNGFDFSGNGKKFSIKAIEQISYPLMKMKDGFSFKEDIYLDIYNYGVATGQVIEIQNIEGNIRWTTEFPKIIEIGNENSNLVRIQGIVVQEADKYKFKMIVLDAKKRKQTYLIQGKDHEFTMELLD